MLNALSARFRAIQQLQAIRARHYPGSPRYEQVEHAIDLALSERRAVNDYLVRNVLRDAKRILNRQTTAWRNVQFVDEIPASMEDDPPSHGMAVVGDLNTPDAILEATQLADSIVADVSRSSRHAPRVMHGLLVDESLEFTANAAGISPVRVNQLRRQLREVAGTRRSPHHGA